MESFTEAWGLVCDLCKACVTEVAYTTWIRRIHPVSLDFDRGIVVLEAPNEFHLRTLTRCYASLLQEAFNETFGEGIQVQLCTPEQLVQNREPDAVPLSKDDYEYTLDTFTVGPSNKFAHAASMAVATRPAVLYNLLFIYGNSGLGKTHLLYAICSETPKSYPQVSIICIKGDEFTNELTGAIRRGTTVKLHRCYCKADVLLADDIQFIAGKDSTQEEFFHTFNTLCEAKRQIVLTSDQPPKDITTLEGRLLTHFEWGLTTDMQPLDFETRITIIRRKTELPEIDLPDNVAEYIANRLKNNIRQLEGVIKKMKAYYLLAGETLSISTAQAAISDVISNHQPALMTIEKITGEMARTFGTSPEDIRSPKRSTGISSARRIAMYMVRGITQLPMISIGETFGGRDHSTVVYTIQQVEEDIGRDPKTRSIVQDIIKNIRDR